MLDGRWHALGALWVGRLAGIPCLGCPVCPLPECVPAVHLLLNHERPAAAFLGHVVRRHGCRVAGVDSVARACGPC